VPPTSWGGRVGVGQNVRVWLSWTWAAVLAGCLGAAGWTARRFGGRAWLAAAAFATEVSLVAGLYAVWQLIGTYATTDIAGAGDHGLWVWHLERRLHLPSELSLQRLTLRAGWFVQLCNGFYAVVHVPALGVFLVWLYFRHRDRYPHYRNVLAVLTFVCFLIQLIPVAPPRLLRGVGFVDTGLLYHQSVYGAVGAGVSDQVSAMPSLHLAWACLIALAVVQVSTSPRRWLVLLHPIATMLVVVVTANHYWLDGIAAAVLLGLSSLVVSGAEHLLAARRRPAPVPEAAPSLQRT
jgi:hypothetical protein